jgi:hypothetical protein
VARVAPWCNCVGGGLLALEDRGVWCDRIGLASACRHVTRESRATDRSGADADVENSKHPRFRRHRRAYDGRAELVAEVTAAPADVRRDLGEEARRLVDAPWLLDGVAGARRPTWQARSA